MSQNVYLSIVRNKRMKLVGWFSLSYTPMEIDSRFTDFTLISPIDCKRDLLNFLVKDTYFLPILFTYISIEKHLNFNSVKKSIVLLCDDNFVCHISSSQNILNSYCLLGLQVLTVTLLIVTVVINKLLVLRRKKICTDLQNKNRKKFLN